MSISSQRPGLAQSRRNLLAGVSILAVALWPRGARADKGGIPHNGGGQGGGGAHCFLRGTLIRTPDGEREIGNLAIGDLVMTHSGRIRPIKWIGRRRLMREREKPWCDEVAPIRVMRSALAEGVPNRDLYLSQWHAIYWEGLLVTIGSLVNGSTIVRCNANERLGLEYLHVELAGPDIVLAEGVPSETLVFESGDYSKFDNWSERLTLDESTKPPVRIMGTVHNITGARRQLSSRLRSALAPFIDRRTDFDKLRDKIDERGERIKAVA